MVRSCEWTCYKTSCSVKGRELISYEPNNCQGFKNYLSSWGHSVLIVTIYNLYAQCLQLRSRVHIVAAVLYLQSVPLVMLFRTWNMFCTFTLLLSEVWSPPHSYLPLMLLRYCLNDFRCLQLPYYYCCRFGFTFHVCWISIIRSVYCRIFSAFLIAFLSPEIATSIIIIIIIIIIRVVVITHF